MKLNLIVATCNKGGIGMRGELPWRIRYLQATDTKCSVVSFVYVVYLWNEHITIGVRTKCQSFLLLSDTQAPVGGSTSLTGPGIIIQYYFGVP